MHKKFGADRTCSSGDMIADRQTHTRTHTHTHTDTLITILRAPYRGQSNKLERKPQRSPRNRAARCVVTTVLIRTVEAQCMTEWRRSSQILSTYRRRSRLNHTNVSAFVLLNYVDNTLPVRRSTYAVVKFSNSRVWDKVPEGSFSFLIL